MEANDQTYFLTWEMIARTDPRVRPGSGGDVKVWCPFCRPGARDKDARCLSVNQRTGLFHCHDDKCEARGKVRNDGDGEWEPSYSTQDIVEHRVDWADPDMRPISPASEEVLAYMSSRGISPETCAIGNVRTFTDHDGIQHVAFVYSNRERTKAINYKRRSIDPDAPKGSRFRSSVGTYKPPYLLHTVERGAEQIVICEAEIDALSLVEAGVRNVVALPSGGDTKNLGKKLSCLEDIRDDINRAKKVIICTDNDEAGIHTAEEIGRRVGFDKIGVVDFPDGIKDANEFLLKFGRDDLRLLVNRPSVPEMDGVSSIYAFSDSLWDGRHTDDDDIGFRSGSMPMLSDYFRIAPGSLVIITGLPEAGKSSFIRAYMMGIAGSNDNTSIAFCAPEDSVIRKDFFRLFVLLVSGKKPSQFESREEFDYIVDMIGERIILLHPEQNTLDSILSRAEYAIERYGVKAVVIDPWTEVEAERLRGEDTQEYLNRCLVRAQSIARNRQVSMVISAHPTKEAQIRSRNSGNPPLLEEISGSAIWRNKAAVGITLHRDVDDPMGETTVEIIKMRDRRVGKRGKVRMRFLAPTGRFEEVAAEDTNSTPNMSQQVRRFPA